MNILSDRRGLPPWKTSKTSGKMETKNAHAPGDRKKIDVGQNHTIVKYILGNQRDQLDPILIFGTRPTINLRLNNCINNWEI